jgi:hypothetical protein
MVDAMVIGSLAFVRPSTQPGLVLIQYGARHTTSCTRETCISILITAVNAH